MKKNIGKRILSLALALVLVVGLLPMTALKAYATPSEAETIPTSNTGKHAYSENLTVYYKHDNYLYKVVFSNIKDLEKVGLCFASSASSTLLLAGDRGLYLAPRSGTTDVVYISNFPTQTGSSVNFYLRYNAVNAVNTGKPVVTVTCVGVGIPTWSWNGTSAATAVFTSTDGNATITVGANITSSIQGATSCLEKDQTTYTATATCNGQTYTDTKTVDGAAGPHSYTYSASGDTLTETCSNNCGHQAIASIVAGEALYTGSEITNVATISYDSGTWAGDEPVLSFENNVNVGTATVKMTAGDATASTTFKINPANISYTTVTFDPENGTYNGNAYAPDVTVTFNGATLVKDTDYTLSWDKNGFITPETYTVRVVGIGNFTGYVDKTFNINAADLDDVEVRQIGTLTYNGGDALTPTVSANAIAVNNQPITFTYCTEQNGIYGSLPSFTEAGTYTVYYKATAPNHNEATGSFTVIVNKAIVTEPTIASKPYTGTVQTADITDTELYTVVKNNGGTGVKLNGYYDVVLELKDVANYKWSSTDNAQVTLQFAITRATNEWTVTPSITGWTYGETAKTPVGSAKFGDVSIQYTGTANDGTQFSSMTAPTKAGNYTATFIVAETEDYSGLETTVDFAIEKATYDMTGAKWDYSEPIKYDGNLHTVYVDESSLPNGVSVSRYTGNNGSDVGKYTANVSLGYDIYNYNQPEFNYLLEWEIKNDWTPIEYTVSALNGNGWLNDEFTIIPAEGYLVSLTNTADGTWEDKLTYTAETENGNVTFYLKNETDGTISLAKTENYKLDKTAPTGKVEFVDRTGWEEFLNTISFGLFYKDEVTVKITANDTLSGIANIEYYEADEVLTLDEVKAIKNWTTYNDSFGVSVEDTKKFVYFVRITDNAGNVTYLSTDGAEYDTTAPVISGVENGKTYYTTQKVTVTEKNIASIKLNGETAGANITLDGNKDATYTIEVIDKAGNKTTVIVSMKPIKDVAIATENLSNGNVTSANEQALADLVAKLDELLADDDLTDGERETLEQHKAVAESLLKTINDTKAEIARINEELNKYNGNTVNSDDAAALEQLAKDIKALTDGGNLTDAERTALSEDASDVAAMQKTVADTKAENDRISDAVDGYDLATVTSDDKADLEQLLADINKQLESTNLTEEEISELNGDKKAVEDLLTKIKGTDELIDKLTEDVDGYSDDTVKSTDKDAIEQIIEDIDALLETENLTDAEEKALEDTKAKAEDLLDAIDDAAKAPATENTEKVKDVTAENVTPEDKTDLKKAKADLEKALEDNGGNYTEDEKKAIEDEIKRIDDALEVIGNVEAVEESISKLPAVDTVEPDDEEAIKAITDAQTAYNALSDYEKSLVDEATKVTLDKLVAALVAYDIVEGDGSSWTEDSNHNITFVVNGLFSKFVGIKVDGKDVDKANYEVKAGSTIITLKASYLDTLAVGEHTITVAYTDGSTDGTFNVHAKANSPATGDDFNIALYGSLMVVSVTALVVLLLASKKRKYAK